MVRKFSFIENKKHIKNDSERRPEMIDTGLLFAKRRRWSGRYI